MKPLRLLSLILSLSLLLGCSEAVPAPTSASAANPETEVSLIEAPSEPPAELPPELPLASSGAIESRILSQWDCVSLYPMGQDLLLLSMDENHFAVLTVFSGEAMAPGRSLTLDSITYPAPEQFQVREYSISYYDNTTGETVALNSRLEEVLRIPPPLDHIYSTVLSRDLRSLYFGTDDGIYALDLDSGRLRCLFSDTTSRKLVGDLLNDDTVLKFTLFSETDPRVCYLDIGSGLMLYEDRSFVEFQLTPGRYYASFREEPDQILLFGSMGSDPNILIPPEDSFMGAFLPDRHRAVSASRNADRTRLELYDLDSGICTASEILTVPFHPRTACETPDGRIWLLGQTRGVSELYCWIPELSPAGELVSRVAAYDPGSASQNTPARDIQVYADSVSRSHGITVLVGEDVHGAAPWDYSFLPETRPQVVRERLRLLDACLSAYPRSMLDALTEDIGGLTISLVQGIYGKEGLDTVTEASGLQYEQGGSHYIALSSEQDLQYSLFHEMCHILDYYVVPRTRLYENWERLNPPDFSYDYDYVANEGRNGEEYLRDGSRSFIDAYAMSFPEEDRARLMEYGMTAGNQHYFQSPVMQEKLRTLSLGIREAFGLQEDPRVFLWEQYLNVPVN